MGFNEVLSLTSLYRTTETSGYDLLTVGLDDDPLARWKAGFDDIFGLVAGGSRSFSPGDEAGCTCWGCCRERSARTPPGPSPSKAVTRAGMQRLLNGSVWVLPSGSIWLC
jgi:hypothetical protein